MTRRGEHGVVLVVVLFFALLLAGSTATFLRRATVDASISHNRDAGARAEAIARGGVRLAEALLAEDRRLEEALGMSSDTLHDVWGRIGQTEIQVDEEATLHLRIEDTSAKLNLNALFADGKALADAELLLTELLTKTIDAMPGRPEEKLYDPVELARSLIDWVDEDEVRVNGGAEDDFYQQQSPPYRAANRPLLALEELREIEGFNARLVAALEPYLDVFPLATGAGINPNTAPSWVLGLLYYRSGSELRLADEEDVRDVLEQRELNLLCPSDAQSCGCPAGMNCIPLSDAVDRMEPGNQPVPPTSLSSDTFRVVATARVGDVERRLVTVIDRRQPADPLRLAWRWQ